MCTCLLYLACALPAPLRRRAVLCYAVLCCAVEADEAHIALAKQVNMQIKSAASSLGVRLPPFL